MNISLADIEPDKLEELVLHISAMSEKDSRFASTKLNKLVWASDFKAFCETGRTITGATYQKGEFGPIPRAMPIILERLATEGRLDLKRVKIGTKIGVRPVAKERANLTAFSQRDLGVVDKVIAENFGKTGTAMSTDTHKHLAHKVAEKGETIPFAAWLISARKPTDKEKKHGLALVAKHAQKS
jgi:Protein of unknown function (DUF4065)